MGLDLPRRVAVIFQDALYISYAGGVIAGLDLKASLHEIKFILHVVWHIAYGDFFFYLVDIAGGDVADEFRKFHVKVD